MSENFQNPPFLGTSSSLQLSCPAVSNVASLPGSACNFLGVSAPAVSAAWLLPSALGTSFQPLIRSAYLYQHPSTTVLSGVTDQSQVSASVTSCPGAFEWVITGGTEVRSSSLRDFTGPVTDQDTVVSSMAMASQYNKVSGANNMVPLYPSLSASLVQGAPSQIPNQGHSLSLPYPEGSQAYYSNQGTLGPLLSVERGPYLQCYGSVSYTQSRASAPQPEVVMVLKEIQPTNMTPTASTPGIYYSVSAQPITETSFQVAETSLGMEASLGLQPPSQTFVLPQTPDFSKSHRSRNIQVLEQNLPPEHGDISMVAPVQRPSNLLALPPALSQEQKENKNLDDITTKLSKPLDAYQIPIENQHSPLLPLEIPDIHQLLACIEPLGQEQQSDCENAGLGKNNLSLKDQGMLENGTESNDGFADINTLVEDIHLPHVLNSLDDLDQSKSPKMNKTKDTRAIKLNEVHKRSNVTKAPSDQPRKNKRKASKPVSGVCKAKVKRETGDCMFLEKVIICNVAASDKAPLNVAKHSKSKPQKAAPSRNSKTKSVGHEKTERTKENSKKAEESKQSGNKVKAEEKPAIPKMKWKRNQCELIQKTFKKPRSSLGMHLLESVQVFHALGKKSDKKNEFASSWPLPNSSQPKGPQLPPAVKQCLGTLCETKGPEKTQVKLQKPDGSADKECSSPSQYELPPPGKVKLIPLLFPTLDKPQARPVPRRPQSLASRGSATASPARAGSNSAQPTLVNSSQPTPGSSTGLARPAGSVMTKPARPGLTIPAQPLSNSADPTTANLSQQNSASVAGPARPAEPISINPVRPGLTNPAPSAASRPAPYKKSSCTSFHQKPIHTAVTKPPTPLKPPNQYLLQDFALQPIPWRKPNVPGPVMSTPITNEQRPEREAMKRKAQLEREKAAKNSFLGKHLLEREKEMEISLYYGYAN